MEDLFTFAREYYTDGNMDFDRFIPHLSVKLRDQLCLKGRKIEYRDFTKVIKRGDRYMPLVCWTGEPKKDDIVLDFAPLYSVGVAEFVTMLSHSGDLADMKFLGWCQELPFADDWYGMKDKAGKMMKAKCNRDAI